FLFKAPPTTSLSTLSLHDALPIFTLQLLDHALRRAAGLVGPVGRHRVERVGKRDDLCNIRYLSVEKPIRITAAVDAFVVRLGRQDRKSTRLNSSHLGISYAVFCLK